jgi:hypothetical protein
MPIIFFGGAGVSAKMMEVEFKNNKYVKNNFISKLRKIDKVILPDLQYKHVYHYQEPDDWGQKKFFKPIRKLELDDMYIEKTIKNLDFDKKKKYIVMGHSDGIYPALEFAKQYPKLVDEIISLDGSWITVKLCKQRLVNWKARGKKVKLIKTQKELDDIMEQIVKSKNKDAMQKILNHKRYEHTKRCIDVKYQDIAKKHKFTIFRDYNSKINEDIDQQFNEYSLLENDIMSKLSKKYQIFWQIDAGHGLWFNELYKEQIINYIKCLYK